MLYVKTCEKCGKEFEAFSLSERACITCRNECPDSFKKLSEEKKEIIEKYGANAHFVWVGIPKK